MITKYSYDNVEAMIKSIHSNSELIDNMVKTTRKNDKHIAERMSYYAGNKGVFSHEQIELYKGYVENKEDVEAVLDTYAKELENIGGIKQISTQVYQYEESFKTIHAIFNKINTLQIKIMEMLCGMIGRANLLMSAI